MQLSKNFTLEEMLWSQTAYQKGIKNEPKDWETEKVISNLKALCTYVLQPTRDKFGPLTVTSGYSCLALATILGRKPNSQHCTGEAADIVSTKVTNLELADWLSRNIDFDQLIYECRYRKGTRIRYDWVHVSYKKDGGNRNQVLYSPPSGGYLYGLPKKSLV